MIWIAGQLLGGHAWTFIGAFSTEKRAVAACIEPNDFVAPAELNVPAPREPTPWAGAYCPKARRK